MVIIRITVIMMRRVCLENIFIDVFVCLGAGGVIPIRIRVASISCRGVLSFFFAFWGGVRVEA
jgi:hypothetical protein